MKTKLGKPNHMATRSKVQWTEHNDTCKDLTYWINGQSYFLCNVFRTGYVVYMEWMFVTHMQRKVHSWNKSIDE